MILQNTAKTHMVRVSWEHSGPYPFYNYRQNMKAFKPVEAVPLNFQVTEIKAIILIGTMPFIWAPHLFPEMFLLVSDMMSCMIQQEVYTARLGLRLSDFISKINFLPFSF